MAVTSEATHPLSHPGWMVFTLVVLAVPLGALFAPASAPPLPHLARMPLLDATVLHGADAAASTVAGVVDITAWPCADPCIARTATMAALAHSSTAPPLVSIMTTPPDEHPALDAARAVDQWTVVQTSNADALHAEWFRARADRPLPMGGLLVVDHNGSIRGVVPASPEGVEMAIDLWDHLQSLPPG
ncbi:MAG: hypothetical protein CL927_12580 [Deltaproteobacteria bacterium]|nr:hypothetical protein [Deltaproteobacteria bacterium]HCH61573.1 hypothetical protein [Deltaproteobacteria bacterium]